MASISLCLAYLLAMAAVFDAVMSLQCSNGEFECDDKCVPGHWKCDNHFDCLDKMDEVGCAAVKCTLGQFQCGNGQCISRTRRCDGHPNCKDGSDELHCTIFD
ncbi:low-density lipoprotein receptor-like [Haliotis asinina]|uniref:low-density lipoprotein receptor-like n=1 Tax=Haliotis asinina TaxID=109174 RepID=UPI003531C96D